MARGFTGTYLLPILVVILLIEEMKCDTRNSNPQDVQRNSNGRTKETLTASTSNGYGFYPPYDPYGYDNSYGYYGLPPTGYQPSYYNSYPYYDDGYGRDYYDYSPYRPYYRRRQYYYDYPYSYY